MRARFRLTGSFGDFVRYGVDRFAVEHVEDRGDLRIVIPLLRSALLACKRAHNGDNGFDDPARKLTGRSPSYNSRAEPFEQLAHMLGVVLLHARTPEPAPTIRASALAHVANASALFLQLRAQNGDAGQAVVQNG